MVLVFGECLRDVAGEILASGNVTGSSDRFLKSLYISQFLTANGKKLGAATLDSSDPLSRNPAFPASPPFTQEHDTHSKILSLYHYYWRGLSDKMKD